MSLGRSVSRISISRLFSSWFATIIFTDGSAIALNSSSVPASGNTTRIALTRSRGSSVCPVLPVWSDSIYLSCSKAQDPKYRAFFLSVARTIVTWESTTNFEGSNHTWAVLPREPTPVELMSRSYFLSHLSVSFFGACERPFSVRIRLFRIQVWPRIISSDSRLYLGAIPRQTMSAISPILTQRHPLGNFSCIFFSCLRYRFFAEDFNRSSK